MKGDIHIVDLKGLSISCGNSVRRRSTLHVCPGLVKSRCRPTVIQVFRDRYLRIHLDSGAQMRLSSLAEWSVRQMGSELSAKRPTSTSDLWLR